MERKNSEKVRRTEKASKTGNYVSRNNKNRKNRQLYLVILPLLSLFFVVVQDLKKGNRT